MPIQEYKLYTQNNYNGMLAYASENTTVVTGINDATITNMGIALKKEGTDLNSVAVGTSTSATGAIFGISLREINHEAVNRPSDGTSTYPISESISVLRQGTINLIVNTAAAVAGAKVAFNKTTGVASGGGSTSTYQQATNVSWLESGAIGDIIKARIDIVA